MEEREEQKRDWNSISYTERDLTEEEKTKLNSDAVISDFKQMKLEKEAKKNWDLFYKRNTTKFFKDRHWTRREFEELCNSEVGGQSKVFFEVGCGVGNFMFPLLEDDSTSFFYACDFSPRAVDFVKAHPAYNVDRCKAFQCDITSDSITDNCPEQSVDVATLIFVLSAISPEKMLRAVQNIVPVLKPGGCLLFRDYGLYDHAMLRFAKGNKISDSFYVRQDGTRAYYFSIEKINDIMRGSGLDIGHCSYIHRATVNKKEDIDVQRIFVQGKFVKPTWSQSLLSSQDDERQNNVDDTLHSLSSEKLQTTTDTSSVSSENSNDMACMKTDTDLVQSS